MRGGEKWPQLPCGIALACIPKFDLISYNVTLVLLTPIHEPCALDGQKKQNIGLMFS